MKSTSPSAQTTESCPAVIIGGELNGLGVCRSLARGGVPIYVLDRKRLNPAMWSRHAMPVRVSALHGRELLNSLRALQGTLGQRPVLIITDEMALLTISELRDELNGLFRFRLPTHETVIMLHNKAQFHEYAVANDFPVPKGVVLRDVADIPRLQSLRFPVIIKPADKRYFHSGDAPRLVIAPDWKKAASFSRKLLESVGEVIVQERVDGPDNSIYFCLFYRGASGATVMFTGRKLASSPPHVGSTAFCISAADVGKNLERITHSFLERVEYVGLGGIEYKWDAAYSRFVMIEPTVGRTDWQEEIATLSGINVPLAGYYHECELPQPAYRLSDDHIVWQASRIERMKIRSDVIPSGAAVVDGYWRRDDPLPALIHYPRDLVISAPAIISAWSGRFGQRCGDRIHRLGRLIRPA